MRLTTLKWASIALASALHVMLVLNASAKVCNTTQLTQLTNVVTTYSSSADCTGSTLDPRTNDVAEICAGACMQLVRQLQPDTPDCEFDGTNLGESMSRLVAWCDTASVSASGLASASSGFNSRAGWNATDSISISIDTLDTVPVCSIENVSLISEINKEATKSADCFGMGGPPLQPPTRRSTALETRASRTWPTWRPDYQTAPTAATTSSR